MVKNKKDVRIVSEIVKAQQQPMPARQCENLKEMYDSLNERFTGMNKGVDELTTRIEELDTRYDDHEEELDAVKVGVIYRIKQVEEPLRKDIKSLSDEVANLREVQEKMAAQLQAATRQMEETVTKLACRVEISKPKSFKGSRNVREVDDFLLGLDQYFAALGMVNEDTKIQTAAMYLKNTAMLWWQRMQKDIKIGKCEISSFDDFKKELKRRFYPADAARKAFSRLRRLKQTGTIQKYVKEFSALALQIPNMSEENLLFLFQDGLQPWAQMELSRREVQDLDTAIRIAESLTDYSKKISNRNGEDDDAGRPF